MLRRFPNRGCVARFSWVCHPHAYLARKLTGKLGGRLVPRIRTALRLPNWDVVWTKMRWAWRSSLTLFSIHTRRSFLRQLRLPQRDNMSSTDCHSLVRTSCFLWNLSSGGSLHSVVLLERIRQTSLSCSLVQKGMCQDMAISV